MKAELESLVNRKVDLVSKKAIENSPNWIRRQNILAQLRSSMSRDSAALVDIFDAIQLINQYIEGVEGLVAQFG